MEVSLPSEIITQIFSYLPDGNLVICSFVCQQWRDIAKEIILKEKIDTSSENIWLSLFDLKYPDGFKPKITNLLEIQDQIKCDFINLPLVEKTGMKLFQSFDQENQKGFFIVLFSAIFLTCLSLITKRKLNNKQVN